MARHGKRFPRGTPLVDTFLDLGVDTLNPVQQSANDLDDLRRRTAGKMALQGGVPSELLVRGPVEAIRAEARRLMWQLGRDGGYFCSPDQSMPWPQEHLEAFEAEVGRSGVYPLEGGGQEPT